MVPPVNPVNAPVSLTPGCLVKVEEKMMSLPCSVRVPVMFAVPEMDVAYAELPTVERTAAAAKNGILAGRSSVLSDKYVA